MAFSNPGYSTALQAAIDYARSKGAVVVAAVGNDASSVATYPAGDTGVVGVSATNSSDVLWASSNFGADVFMAAPGVGIETTDASGTYSSITGTSAAAAEVAGAAALMLAVDPSATAGAIIGRLARNADSAGTADQSGNGRLNLARALADTSTAEVVPAGAPGGGPLVGPYLAAALGVTASFESTVPSITANGTDPTSIMNNQKFYRYIVFRTFGRLDVRPSPRRVKAGGVGCCWYLDHVRLPLATRSARGR